MGNGFYLEISGILIWKRRNFHCQSSKSSQIEAQLAKNNQNTVFPNFTSHDDWGRWKVIP